MQYRSRRSTPKSRRRDARRTRHPAGPCDPGGHRYQRAGIRSAFPAGNEALLLLAIHQGLVRPCLSDDILDEYARVLARPRFAFTPDEISALLAMLRDKGELFQPQGAPATSPDSAVTKFLQCAAAAQAEFLVTGNKRDFPHSPYGPTRVVNAGDLLDRITLAI